MNVTTLLVVVLVGLAILLVAIVVLYNRLVRNRFHVSEGFSRIDVQLTRRHNLVPNLVNIVKGYADFERGVLEDVTRLRTQMRDDT